MTEGSDNSSDNTNIKCFVKESEDNLNDQSMTEGFKDNDKASRDKLKKIGKNKNSKKHKVPKKYWTIKITIVTFFLSAFFSFFSQITATKTGIVISSILLVFLVLISILFDAIGVCVTSCDLAPLNSLASRKIPGSKIAIRLVKNAEKVANICNDVIGDVCGIISGACSVAIVVKIIEITKLASTFEFIISLILSSIVAAVTVGGKAYFKDVAMNNSKDMIMFTAKILNIFIKDK